ncbi:MAG: hypothetical protein IKN55_12515 [Oscillospiraceae bacterium]|nr:hypothetical protein [Oscillospiraceae bacterium]
MWLFSAFVSLLTTNLIFTRALGTSTLMAASKSRSNLLVLAAVMTIFSAFACFLTSVLFSLFGLTILLQYPYSLGLPLVYTLVISGIYIVMLLLMHRFAHSWFAEYKKYIHFSAFNCAVMGTLYLAFEPVESLKDLQLKSDVFVLGNLFTDRLNPGIALLFGLQEGLGFLVAALMLSAVRERLYDKEIPAAFRGLPAVLIFLGIISMAVYALASSV